jgi:ADP-ribose 1''-phosphate phosphatase
MGQESEHEIAKFTAEAMQDLKLQLENPERIENSTVRNIVTSYNNQTSQNNALVDVSNYTVNMPKINSGIFGVPWELTERALIESGMDCQVFEL